MPTPDEILNNYDKEYQDSSQGLRFQPPDGDYSEAITDVTVSLVTRKVNNEKVKVPAVQIVGEILSGDYEGKKNSLGMFTVTNFGMMKDVVDILGGDPEVGITAAREYLTSKIGTCVTVSVSTSQQEGGRKFKNANIVAEILESPTGDAEAVADDDPPAAEEPDGADPNVDDEAPPTD